MVEEKLFALFTQNLAQESLTMIFEIYPVAVILFDRKGNYVFSNQKVEDVIGKHCNSFLQGFNLLEFKSNYTSILRREFYNIVTKNKSTCKIGPTWINPKDILKGAPDIFLYLTLNLYPLYGKEGDITYVLVTLENNTPQVEKSLFIKKTEFNLKQLIENIPLSVMVIDEDLTFLKINEHFIKEFGYTLSEIPTLEDFATLIEMKKKDLRSFKLLFSQARESSPQKVESPHVIHIYNRWKEEKAIKPSVMYLVNGVYLVFLNDITAYYRKEDYIHEIESVYRDILENAPSLIYIKNREGKFIYGNKLFLQTFHLTKESIKDKNDFEIFPEKIARIFNQNDFRVLNEQEAKRFEEEIEIEGNKVYFISVKFPLFNHLNEFYGICGIMMDITEKKNVELALRLSYDQLMEINDSLIKKRKENYEKDLQVQYSSVISMISSMFIKEPLIDKNLEDALQTIGNSLKIDIIALIQHSNEREDPSHNESLSVLWEWTRNINDKNTLRILWPIIKPILVDYAQNLPFNIYKKEKISVPLSILRDIPTIKSLIEKHEEEIPALKSRKEQIAYVATQIGMRPDKEEEKQSQETQPHSHTFFTSKDKKEQHLVKLEHRENEPIVIDVKKGKAEFSIVLFPLFLGGKKERFGTLLFLDYYGKRKYLQRELHLMLNVAIIIGMAIGNQKDKEILDNLLNALTYNNIAYFVMTYKQNNQPIIIHYNSFFLSLIEEKNEENPPVKSPSHEKEIPFMDFIKTIIEKDKKETHPPSLYEECVHLLRDNLEEKKPLQGEITIKQGDKIYPFLCYAYPITIQYKLSYLFLLVPKNSH